jgi:glycosyltransferase involved in cell wall biosynthesis
MRRTALVADVKKLPPAGKKHGWPWDTPVRRLPAQMPNGKEWPRITIVTPAYNQAHYLEETIRSVLLQGYPNLEYIVINDGSADNTEDVIRRYEPWISYWTTQKNAGQPTAINNGFARSTGEIMGWLNSDDLLLPQALERSTLARQRNPKAKVTCGFRLVIDEASRVVKDWIVPLVDNQELGLCCFMAQETVLWNREVWEKIGPLEPHWRVILDYEYWHRMIANGYEFSLIPAFLGCFRSYPECKTNALADVGEREQQQLRERYLGCALNSWDAFNRTNLWLKNRLVKALPRAVFHSPATAGAVLKIIDRAAHLFRNTPVARVHRNGWVLK